jgi:hypothetical protein
MTKISISKTIIICPDDRILGFGSFENLNFGFVSNFDLPANACARVDSRIGTLLLPAFDHPDQQRLWQAGI